MYTSPNPHPHPSPPDMEDFHLNFLGVVKTPPGNACRGTIVAIFQVRILRLQRGRTAQDGSVGREGILIPADSPGLSNVWDHGMARVPSSIWGHSKWICKQALPSILTVTP